MNRNPNTPDDDSLNTADTLAIDGWASDGGRCADDGSEAWNVRR